MEFKAGTDALAYSTYLGGSANTFPIDTLRNVAVDGAGHIFLTGQTTSTESVAL